MSWTTPIYDRSATDILNRTSKAFFNVVDWMRVYNNCIEIRTLFDTLGYRSCTLNVIAEPTTVTIPTPADFNKLVENVVMLQDVASFPETVGLVTLKYDYTGGSNADAPNYQDINSIEENTYLLYTMVQTISDYAVQCGVANCGQPRFWQHRFI
jgi:hypothetical protein